MGGDVFYNFQFRAPGMIDEDLAGAMFPKALMP